MKHRLLLDQNISRRLIASLPPEFLGSAHVAEIGLASADDLVIWDYARDNGLAILSKDSDFHHLSFLYGAPPKTIWVRLGNCSTDQVAHCVERNRDAIANFLSEPDSALLILG